MDIKGVIVVVAVEAVEEVVAVVEAAGKGIGVALTQGNDCLAADLIFYSKFCAFLSLKRGVIRYCNISHKHIYSC